MFETILDIKPNGYDIDQTNFHLNSLYNKIYMLEKQNEALIKSLASLESLENKVNLILEHLNIKSETETCDSEIIAVAPVEEEIELATITETEDVQPVIENEKPQTPDFSFLRNEINSLKSFLKE